MVTKFMEILVSQDGSQGASQGGSTSARSSDLVRPGVVPPLLTIIHPASQLPTQLAGPDTAEPQLH